jgi:hypothetical protein
MLSFFPDNKNPDRPKNRIGVFIILDTVKSPGLFNRLAMLHVDTRIPAGGTSPFLPHQ